jgi:hypothetical protein
VSFSRVAHYCLVGGSLCLILHGVLFSESGTGKGGQAMVNSFQKGFAWC